MIKPEVVRSIGIRSIAIQSVIVPISGIGISLESPGLSATCYLLSLLFGTSAFIAGIELHRVTRRLRWLWLPPVSVVLAMLAKMLLFARYTVSGDYGG